MKSYILVAFVSWLAVVILMTYGGQQGNETKLIPWEYSGFDWMVLQKMLLIVFLLSFLLRYLDRENFQLAKVANLSSALFFIHPLVLAVARSTGALNLFPGFGGFVALSLVVTVSSFLLAYIIKELFGYRSRYLIGF